MFLGRSNPGCLMRPLYGEGFVEFLRLSSVCLIQTGRNHTCATLPTMRGSRGFPGRSQIRSAGSG